MKKYLLLAAFALSIQLVHAQDLKRVETSYMITKTEDAKQEVDKVMADPKQKDKQEAIFWKAKVYAAIYKDAKLRDKYPNALKDADEATKKYIESDPGFVWVKTKGAEGFFDMYGTSYQTGVKQFNDKKWDDAATSFKVAVDYSDIIFKNKWTNVAISFDTTTLLYLAYSYQNGQKPAEAAKYYGRLADNKVQGDTYIDVYKFLANHYTIAKNELQFKKYMAIARELYPKYGGWDEYEIDYMDQNLTLAQKTKLYETDDAAGSLTEIKYLQFGDIFVSAKNKDTTLDSLQLVQYSLKAADAYKKAFAKNAQNGIAAYNVGVIYYNMYGEYDDTYASNIRAMQALNADRPVEKDPKKKAAADAALKAKLDPIKLANATIEKPLMDNLDMSLQWLEKAYAILKDKATRTSTEKSVINKSVDFLANLYAYKRDKLRGKDPKAVDVLDAKYKEFDGLHGKY